MVLEVIGYTVQDVIRAEEAGADRIEFIKDYSTGGLTPDYDLIDKVVKSVTIPINVMVRPHDVSFVYDQDDIAQMKKDIDYIKTTNANGIVLGPLTKEGQIDVPALTELLADTGDLEVTFHKAFDELNDMEAAIDILSEFPQIRRILTSGGKASALDARDIMQKLVKKAADKGIIILAGGGLTDEGLDEFLKQTAVSEIHFGKWVRDQGHADSDINIEKIGQIKSIMKSVKSPH